MCYWAGDKSPILLDIEEQIGDQYIIMEDSVDTGSRCISSITIYIAIDKDTNEEYNIDEEFVKTCFMGCGHYEYTLGKKIDQTMSIKPHSHKMIKQD